MDGSALMEEVAQSARQWAIETHVPYGVVLDAIKEGRLEAMRFSPRGQFYVMPSAMAKFFEDAKARARKS